MKMKGKHSGIALIEVLVSVAIIGVGLAAVFRALDTCVRTTDQARERRVASMLLAESLMEAASSERLSPSAEMSGKFEVPFERYSWRWEKRLIEYSPFLRVSATVEWKRAGRTRSLTAERTVSR